MSAKTFCPIMTIGFDPPKEGKRDLRLCMKDCAWYNPTENDCQVNIIANLLAMSELHESDMSDYLGDIACEVSTAGKEPQHEPIGFVEEPGFDYYRFGKRP